MPPRGPPKVREPPPVAARAPKRSVAKAHDSNAVDALLNLKPRGAPIPPSIIPANWLVGGSSSSPPPVSLLRRLSLVWLRHPRARARAAARRHARGGYERDRDRDRRTGGGRREQRRPAAWRRREMQRSCERRRWLRDGRGGGAGWSRRGALFCGGSEVIFWGPLFAGGAGAGEAACPWSWPTRGRNSPAKPDENTPHPVRAVPEMPFRQHSATRDRVVWVAVWRVPAARGPGRRAGGFAGAGTAGEQRTPKKYLATSAKQRTAAQSPRSAAVTIPQPPPPLVTALHLAAPPGRRTSLLSPASAGSAIAVTVSLVTAPRVTSRRGACACTRMT